MKAAEAAFKNSVDVWEGSTNTEPGTRLQGRGRRLKPLRDAC
ncbi:hypothetical protein J2X52_001393 [Luteimonas sp. 3794]|nr:hypothetical protein [Luteimonas sp. 3794]